jgi:hypothetical protein
MKRNEFKALIKECIRECIREVIREQVFPAPWEGTQQRPMLPSPSPGLGALAMYENKFAPSQRQPNYAVTDMDEPAPMNPYANRDSGYMSPDDYIHMARTTSRPRVPRADLDIPVAPRNQAPRAQSNQGDVLENILRDTAQTTLRVQAAKGHTKPGWAPGGGGGEDIAVSADPFARAIADHDPRELFPGASNWANLAAIKR